MLTMNFQRVLTFYILNLKCHSIQLKLGNLDKYKALFYSNYFLTFMLLDITYSNSRIKPSVIFNNI
ncbi:hypothetical protein Xbed_00369 [Xenorhabdus beddingii]|uniref:Uncharacterized protein n=1 Tax=Xenorhabdus beddingii TaxID=40578 RepID=A0A1Y2SR86_9GAMM|nr:hypothetical protein Xbed_00369 [Xenorhabdus beddingii]